MQNVDALTTKPTRFARIMHAYRETFTNMFHSLPFWLVAGLMLLCLAYMLLTGKGAYLFGLWYPYTYNIILFLVVIPLTAGRAKAPWEYAPTLSRTRLWIQVGFCLLMMLILNLIVAFLFGLIDLRNLPLLGSVFVPLLPMLKSSVGQTIFAQIIEIFLPLLFVLLLGARWRDLGFCKGYRSLIMGFLGAAMGIIVGIVALSLGKIAFLPLITLYTYSFLIAGTTEEVFLRGIVMTRFTQLFDVRWGIALSGLLFGLTHFATTLHLFDNSVLPTLATIILHNGFGGWVFGFIFYRTRSLTATVLIHGFNDAEGPLESLLNLPF